MLELLALVVVYGRNGQSLCVCSISSWVLIRSRFCSWPVLGSVSFFQRSSFDSSLLGGSGYSLMAGLKVCSSLNFRSASVISYFVFYTVAPYVFNSAFTVGFM